MNKCLGWFTVKYKQKTVCGDMKACENDYKINGVINSFKRRDVWKLK